MSAATLFAPIRSPRLLKLKSCLLKPNYSAIVGARLPCPLNTNDLFSTICIESRLRGFIPLAGGFILRQPKPQTILQPSINLKSLLTSLISVNKLASKELHFGNPLPPALCYPIYQLQCFVCSLTIEKMPMKDRYS